MKGRGKSDEHRKKLSDAKIGCTLSDTHRENIGKSVTGTKRSDESKKRYSLSKMGDKNPVKRQDVKDKIRNTVLQNYEDNPQIKDKISLSLTKYFKSNDNYVSLEDFDSYKKYRSLVDNLTKRIKNKLIEMWDGHDYYDNEYIKDNFELNYNDSQYPTIDHKISILEGFKKGYLPRIISSIDNLCITKRALNTSKGALNESDFIEKLRK